MKMVFITWGPFCYSTPPPFNYSDTVDSQIVHEGMTIGVFGSKWHQIISMKMANGLASRTYYVEEWSIHC